MKDSIYIRTMSEINHTLTKLNIEAYDDKQLIEFGINTYYKKKFIDWDHIIILNHINIKLDKYELNLIMTSNLNKT